MNAEHRLLKKVSQTRRGQSYCYPLLGSIVVLAVFWIGLWKWGAAISGSMEVKIALLGLLVAWLAYRLIMRATRKNLRDTATYLDSALDSHNQLEAMIELKDSDHPLRIPQEEHAESELGYYKPVPWTPLLALAGILLCIELGGVTPHLFLIGQDRVSQPENTDPPPAKKNEFAELKLTKPESEIRLKPMDEVAWEGTGRSSNGFDDLALAIYLNGESVTNLPLAKALGKPGELKMAGSFFLDELNAEPFDVVSYYLVAHSKVNSESAKEVVSIPRFIEVRPFREDARVLEDGGKSPDGPKAQQMADILSFIHKVLEFELVLNKAVFAARTADLAQNDPVFVEQVGILKQEQKQLKQELNTFLADVAPELLSPNMLTSLKSAEDYMDAAGTQLARIAPEQERTDTP